MIDHTGYYSMYKYINEKLLAKTKQPRELDIASEDKKTGWTLSLSYPQMPWFPYFPTTSFVLAAWGALAAVFASGNTRRRSSVFALASPPIFDS